MLTMTEKPLKKLNKRSWNWKKNSERSIVVSKRSMNSMKNWTSSLKRSTSSLYK